MIRCCNFLVKMQDIITASNKPSESFWHVLIYHLLALKIWKKLLYCHKYPDTLLLTLILLSEKLVSHTFVEKAKSVYIIPSPMEKQLDLGIWPWNQKLGVWFPTVPSEGRKLGYLPVTLVLLVVLCEFTQVGYPAPVQERSEDSRT